MCCPFPQPLRVSASTAPRLRENARDWPPTSRWPRRPRSATALRFAAPSTRSIRRSSIRTVSRCTCSARGPRGTARSCGISTTISARVPQRGGCCAGTTAGPRPSSRIRRASLPMRFACWPTGHGSSPSGTASTSTGFPSPERARTSTRWPACRRRRPGRSASG